MQRGENEKKLRCDESRMFPDHPHSCGMLGGVPDVVYHARFRQFLFVRLSIVKNG